METPVFDSDTVLLTDNAVLIRTAMKNYDRFKIPTCYISTKKVSRVYTAEQQADLDISTAVNKIGEIVNLSQILNSLYWNNISNGQSFEENEDLYADICTLAVLSGTEINYRSQRMVTCVKMNILNCWDIIKLYLLQRGDETGSSVNAAKAERKIKMA